jgi:hypothetical protein
MNSTVSPTLTTMDTLAEACQTYQDYVMYAKHDIKSGARTDAEIGSWAA